MRAVCWWILGGEPYVLFFSGVLKFKEGMIYYFLLMYLAER